MAAVDADDVEQGRAVLTDALRGFHQMLGERLVSAYALGSLAHGGFSSLVSDVDLGLVLADPLHVDDAEIIRQVAEEVKAKGSALHKRLSVFWGTPSTLRGDQAGGRFPPLDLLDLIQHGLLLSGPDARRDLPQPGRDELLVAGAEFALDFLAGVRSPGGPTSQRVGSMRPAGEDAVEQIRRPDLLWARGVRQVTKLVLFPVRFVYTAKTGLVGTNQLATEHYLAQGKPPGADLVAAALTWRTQLPDEGAAIPLLKQGMVPLYLHYIDDHVARLTEAGRPDLAEDFAEWRARILA